MHQLKEHDYTVKELLFMTTKQGWQRLLLKNNINEKELDDDTKIVLTKEELETYCK